MTTKLIPVSDNTSIGIVREIISIETAIKCFDALYENISNSTVDIGQGRLSKSICELVPKVFVPKNSTKESQLNPRLLDPYMIGGKLH